MINLNGVSNICNEARAAYALERGWTVIPQKGCDIYQKGNILVWRSYSGWVRARFLKNRLAGNYRSFEKFEKAIRKERSGH